jgi:DNA-binding beta-propeller fold protein YncE
MRHLWLACRASATSAGRLALLLAILVMPRPPVAAEEGRLALTMRDEARLEIRGVDGELLGEVPTGPGPRAITLHGGKLFVANRGLGQTPGSTVTVVDGNAATIESTLGVCLECAPRDLLFDAAGRMWFTGQAHQVLYWSFPPYEFPAGSIVVGLGWPSTLARLDDGKTILVGFREGGLLALVDTERQTFSRIEAITAPTFVAARGGTREFWVGSDRGSAVVLLRAPDSADELPRTEVILPQAFLGGIAFTPDGRFAVLSQVAVNSVTVLDASDGSVVSRHELEGQPGEVAVSRDGRRIAVNVPERKRIEILALDGKGGVSPAGGFAVPGAIGDLEWLP